MQSKIVEVELPNGATALVQAREVEDEGATETSSACCDSTTSINDHPEGWPHAVLLLARAQWRHRSGRTAAAFSDAAGAAAIFEVRRSKLHGLVATWLGNPRGASGGNTDEAVHALKRCRDACASWERPTSLRRLHEFTSNTALTGAVGSGTRRG